MTLALVLAALLSQAQPGAKALAAADAAMTAADFKRALTILKALDPRTASTGELLRAHLLRAECLIALRQPAEADGALADALRLEPSASLDRGAPPTLAAAFERVKATLVGTLAIHSNVPGAMALLDGKPVGPLPVEARLLAGRHTLSLDSKAAEGRTVEVLPDRTTQVALDLAAPGKSPPVAPPPVPKERLAVLGLSPLELTDADRTRAELLSEVALTEAGRSGHFTVYGKSDIQALLGVERQKQLLGCSDDSSACTAEIVGALGAEYLMVGTVGRIGAAVRVDLRVIDTRKGQAVARAGKEVRGDEAALTFVVRTLAREVLSALAPGVVFPEIPPPGVRSPVRTVSLVVGGGGLAALGAAAIVGGLAFSSYKETEAASKAGDVDRYDTARAQVRPRALATDVLVGTGIVALGAAIALFVIGDAPVTVSMAPGAGGLGFALGGEF